MSKLTASPPRRLSKLSEVSTPLWWKKYSLPSSAAMNPNPRSDTIFFTVPFGITRSPPLEHRIERIGPVRERRMPGAREITRRPAERLYFSTPVGKGGGPGGGPRHDTGWRRSQGGNHELVQPAEVRSCAAGDHCRRKQHHLCRLECSRREGAPTPLFHAPGDQVPRQPGGEPRLWTPPGNRPHARRRGELVALELDHCRPDPLRPPDRHRRRLLFPGDEPADRGAGSVRGVVARLPAAGRAGATVRHHQRRDRTPHRLHDGRQAVPVIATEGSACVQRRSAASRRPRPTRTSPVVASRAPLTRSRRRKSPSRATTIA